MGPERQLRILQAVCVIFVTSCVVLSNSLRPTGHSTALVQVLIVLLALWSAYSGFRMQRILTRARSNSPQLAPDPRSTPFARWRVGNIVRLAFATSVGLWAMILGLFGSPSWLVFAMYGLALLLLPLWRPGNAPAMA